MFLPDSTINNALLTQDQVSTVTETILRLFDIMIKTQPIYVLEKMVIQTWLKM